MKNIIKRFFKGEGGEITLINGINKASFNGYTLSIINDKIYIDDKLIDNVSPFLQEKVINITISGNVNVVSINGNITVNGNVNGDVESGGDIIVNGNVSGDVNSNANTECGDVAGDVNTKGNITCKNIEGNIECSNLVSGNIIGDVEVGNLNCQNIEGCVNCDKNITCQDITGDVETEGTLHCNKISGDVTVYNGINIK